MQVIDSGYPSRNAWFTLNISIFDANEGTSNIQLSNYIVYENHTVDNAIGLVTCKNLEGDDVTFTINDPSETFDVQNNHLILKKRLDFEKKDAYNLTLVAMDSGIPSVRASKLYAEGMVALSRVHKNMIAYTCILKFIRQHYRSFLCCSNIVILIKCYICRLKRQ